MKKYFATTLMMAALSACANTPVNKTDNLENQLTSYEWRLVDATDHYGKRMDELFVRPQEPITLRFDQGHVNVGGVCNTLIGAYQLRDHTLKVSSLTSTLMACEPPIQRLDEIMNHVLLNNQRVDWKQDGSGLAHMVLETDTGKWMFEGKQTFDSRYGKPVIEFYRIAPQTKTCEGSQGGGECLLVKQVRYDERGIKVSESPKWIPFTASIEGYLHRDDVEEVVRLKRYTRQGASTGENVYVYDMTVESKVVSP